MSPWGTHCQESEVGAVHHSDFLLELSSDGLLVGLNLPYILCFVAIQPTVSCLGGCYLALISAASSLFFGIFLFPWTGNKFLSVFWACGACCPGTFSVASTSSLPLSLCASATVISEKLGRLSNTVVQRFAGL